MAFQFMRIKGVPADHPRGGGSICEFRDGNLIDYRHPVKERRGTSTHPLVIDTPNTKFLEYRFDCGATSGDNRGMYLRLYTTGAGGGGDAARIYHEVVGVAAANAFGAHISLSMGEGTVKGAITGLGCAMRATLGLPDAALAAGGAYCAIMCEIYSHGSSSDPAAVGELSFFRVVNDGSAKNDVDDKAHLFSIQGFEINTDNLVEAASSEAEYAHNIRILVGTTEMYLMVASART